MKIRSLGRLLSTLVGLTIASLIAPNALAITDGSFESGFGNWQVFGDVLLDDTSVVQQFGTAATDGDVQLFMSNLPNGVPDAGAPLGGTGPFSGTDALTAAALEVSLGLNAGELDTLSPSGNPASTRCSRARGVDRAPLPVKVDGSTTFALRVSSPTSRSARS